jgi:hypothetical protein
MKHIAPRMPTPPPAGEPGPQAPTGFLAPSSSGGRLPEDLLAEQVQRLGVFAAVAGGLWTFGLMMDLVFLRVASSTFQPTPIVTAV